MCLGVWAGVEGACEKALGPAWGQGLECLGIQAFCHLPLPPVTLQLFIVLGNDRANRLAGSLPQVRGCTQIPPLAREKFISRKHARSLPKPHPQYPGS